jgi:hypothetical protein
VAELLGGGTAERSKPKQRGGGVAQAARQALAVAAWLDCWAAAARRGCWAAARRRAGDCWTSGRAGRTRLGSGRFAAAGGAARRGAAALGSARRRRCWRRGADAGGDASPTLLPPGRRLAA